jgi:putative ABC transport system permease protein
VRLKPGVTEEEADHELKAMARALTDRYGTPGAPFALNISSVLPRREELRDLHRALLGAALAVLLIACQNLAHLMMARGRARRREVALRLALGASRAAVVRQMFLESAVVTAGGTALGALIAVWGSFVLANRMPRDIEWIGFMEPQLSWRVFAAACLLAAGSAVLFGLLPAIRIVRGVSLDEPLRDESGTTTGRVRRWFDPLVATEVAISLVLMMGAGLLLRTVHELQRSALGPSSRTVFRAQTTASPLPDIGARRTRRERIVAQVARMPEVQDVATAGRIGVRGAAITAEMSGNSTRLLTMGVYPIVTPNYLRVLGLPILEGRDFEAGDASDPGVAIIDPVAAKWLYPGQDPVGRMLKLGGPASDAPWVRIIGVVRSPYSLEASERYAPSPAVFVVQGRINPFGELLIRTRTSDPRALVSLQARLHQLPEVAVGALRPWDEARARDLSSRGFLAAMFVAMGAVALALAALGLYGVLAYAVSRRRREFGIRLALGAEPVQLLRMVMHDGSVMILAGMGAGAFLALGAGRLLDALLVTVLPSDVWALVLSEALLLGVGVLAVLAPALRAMRADPIEILRAT